MNQLELLVASYNKPIIKRVTAGAPGFMFLIKQPNHKLWHVYVLFCPPACPTYAFKRGCTSRTGLPLYALVQAPKNKKKIPIKSGER